jgi:iron complex outermembrane receptor protein
MKNLFVILLLLSVNTVFAQSDSLVLRSSADEMLNVNGRVLESNIPYSTSIFQEISKDEVVSFTTFTSEEIENLGFNNLYDLLNYIPGFQSFQNSSPYGVMPKIAVRGVSHEFNSSILFLLNGKRLNDSMFGSGTALMSYFDLRIVKRVEVIRGAGTLRFGDKASIGLVNLITNTDQTNASVDLRVPLGSF